MVRRRVLRNFAELLTPERALLNRERAKKADAHLKRFAVLDALDNSLDLGRGLVGWDPDFTLQTILRNVDVAHGADFVLPDPGVRLGDDGGSIVGRVVDREGRTLPLIQQAAQNVGANKLAIQNAVLDGDDGRDDELAAVFNDFANDSRDRCGNVPRAELAAHLVAMLAAKVFLVQALGKVSAANDRQPSALTVRVYGNDAARGLDGVNVSGKVNTDRAGLG